MKRTLAAFAAVAALLFAPVAFAQNIVVDACGHVVSTAGAAISSYSAPGYSVPGTITEDGKTCVKGDGDATAQAEIGATNSTAAANPSANTGLNGVFKGLWTDFQNIFAASGSAAPSKMIQIGCVDVLGNLQAPSPTTPCGFTIYDSQGNQINFGTPSLAAQSGVWTSVPNAATTGGLTLLCSYIVPNNTTGVLCSSGVHQTYHVEVYGNSATLGYLKSYDKATAPTCGTDAPVARRMVPAAGGLISDTALGFSYALGVGLCFTTGIADNDTSPPAANTWLVNVWGK